MNNDRRPDATALKEATRKGVSMATEAIITEYSDNVVRVTREQALAILRSPEFAAQVREIVRSAALECAKEIIAEQLPDLEKTVRAIVADNWDKSVAAAAHSLLEAKLAEIRRKLT